MNRQLCVGIILVCCVLFTSTTYGEHFALICAGACSTPKDYELYWDAASGMYEVLKNKYGYDAERIWFLFSDKKDNDERIDSISTKAGLFEAFKSLAGQIKVEDTLFCFFVGRGGEFGGHSLYAATDGLISDEELGVMRRDIPSKIQTYIFTQPNSGGFCKTLAATGAIVITSAEIDEPNLGKFAESVRDALGGKGGADVDANGRVSIGEAYNFALEQVATWYQTQGKDLPQHCQIDDNGDGVSSCGKLPTEAHGKLALVRFLGMSSEAESAVLEHQGQISTKWGEPEFRDGFESGTLKPIWRWLDPNDDCKYQFNKSDGTLSIKIDSGGNTLWGLRDYDAPRLMRKIRGDFIVETNLEAKLDSPFESAGLLLWGAQDNFIRLELGAGSLELGTGNQVRFTREQNGETDWIAAEATISPLLLLRLKRVGDTITTWYSDNRAPWQELGNAKFDADSEVEVGLFATKSETGTPLEVSFYYFHANFDESETHLPTPVEIEPPDWLRPGSPSQAGDADLTVVDASGKEVKSPETAAEKFLVNGDFEFVLSDGYTRSRRSGIHPLKTETAGLTGWVKWYGKDRTNSPRSCRAVFDDEKQSNVVQFIRKSGAGESRVGLAQDVNIDVTQYPDLKLQFDAKPIFQTSLGRGWVSGGECPVTVEIAFIDKNGIGHTWRHGVYYKGQSQYSDATKTPQGKWFTYTSLPLVEMKPDCLDPVKREHAEQRGKEMHKCTLPIEPNIITRILIFGGGRDFTGRIDNLEFLDADGK